MRIVPFCGLRCWHRGYSAIDYTTGVYSRGASTWSAEQSSTLLSTSSEASYQLAYGDTTLEIDGITVTGDEENTIHSILDCNITADGEYPTTTATVVLPDDAKAYTVGSVNEMNFTFQNDNFYTRAAVSSSGSMAFDQEGMVTISADEAAEYYLDLVANEGCCDLPWYQVEITGSDATEISTKKNDDGIEVFSDNMDSVCIIVTNKEGSEQVTVASDEKSILISQDDGELAVFEDSDTDGDYDTNITQQNHVHSYTEAVTNPTCTEQGYTTHTCACGDSYVDSYVNALGHTKQTIAGKAATCTETGLNDGVKCSACGTVITAQTTVPAKGHSFGAWTQTKAPTESTEGKEERSCSTCGETETRTVACLAHTHNYADQVTAPTCTEKGYTTHTCACGDSYVDSYVNALGHTKQTIAGKAATCTETGLNDGVKCSVCGTVITSQTTVPAKGHSYGDWVQVTAPTIEDKGSEQRTCSNCGGKESRDVAKLENVFGDVSDNDYYATPVAWAASEGITTGKTATTFAPKDDCTRAQIVTFIWRSQGEPEPQATDNPFTDVKESDYYYKAVLWAVENGVTTGTGATTFNPDGNCTRAQAVTFLWRADGKPTPNNKTSQFTDLKADAYYVDAVAWAVENGITNGTGATTFSPEGTCIRGQIVTFLWRYMN